MTPEISQPLPSAGGVARRLGLFPIVAIAFVVALLLSNLAAQKLINVFGFTFTAGILLFPVTYIFGDCLTEVYGFARARLVIWCGFVANVFMAAFMSLVVWMAPAEGWLYQASFASVFEMVPRTVLASVVAYWSGEFMNSYVLARLKVKTGGRHLWVRTISSTVLGQAMDTVLFIVIAFWGVLPTGLLIRAAISGYIFKVLYEVLATPLTYTVVRWLKRIDREDVYDAETNFNPFAIRDF
ncbi:MAG TPA: queuosine precursor transporter [Chthoniobacterales bacterium]|nr:queuosine precursor transporter [Chthoniobacterales bacterium]